MKTVVTTRLIAGAAAAAAIAAPAALAAGTGSASAFTIKQGPSFSEVWLSHDETVKAAHFGLASIIDQPGFLRDHTGVTAANDSRYRVRIHRVNGQLRINVSAQQLLDEAAAQPAGQIAIGYFSDHPDTPIGIVQYWPPAQGN